jgi:uncharacterized membrane protein YesL
MKFIHYIGRAFVKFRYDVAEIFTTNLLWLLLTLPVITAPGALAGLFYSINQLSKNEPITTRTFMEGFRKFFWVGWLWTLLNLAVYGLIYFNISYYLDQRGIVGIALGLAAVWTVIQMYVFPLFIENQEKSLFDSVRSALLLIFQRPGPIYFTALVLVMLNALSIFLLGMPFAIFMGSLNAYLITVTLFFVMGKTEYLAPLREE